MRTINHLFAACLGMAFLAGCGTAAAPFPSFHQQGQSSATEPRPAIRNAARALVDSVANVAFRPAGVAGAVRVPVFNHVFLIIGENTSLRDVTSANMPYLVNTLTPEGGSLTDYKGLHGGSLSDYIGLTAGHYTRCDVNDALPYNLNTNKPTCIDRGPSIFSQLDKSNISWTEWNESMPNPCGFFDVGTDWSYNVYSTHHNPAVYFTSVEGARYWENFNRAPNPECLQRVLPMGSTAPNDTSVFDAALATGNVSKFNMIVPNGCEDSHDLCGPRNRLSQFDDFLAREVPKILASSAFGSDGLVVITFDEWGDATPNDKRVAFVALGPAVRPGSSDNNPYNHYSLLRTLEDGYGLHHYLGGAATAKAIIGVWK